MILSDTGKSVTLHDSRKYIQYTWCVRIYVYMKWTHWPVGSPRAWCHGWSGTRCERHQVIGRWFFQRSRDPGSTREDLWQVMLILRYQIPKMQWRGCRSSVWLQRLNRVKTRRLFFSAYSSICAPCNSTACKYACVRVSLRTRASRDRAVAYDDHTHSGSKVAMLRQLRE